MLSHRQIIDRFRLDEESADFDAKAIDAIQLAGFEHGKDGLTWDDACVKHAVDLDIEHTAQILFVTESKVKRIYVDAWAEGIATRVHVDAAALNPAAATKKRRAARASA